MRLGPYDTSKIKVGTANQGQRPNRGRRAGGVGCGAIVIALIGAVVFGIDPSQTMAVLGGLEQSATSAPSATSDLTEEENCNANPYAREACEALTSLNETWQPEFRRAGIEFIEPELWFAREGQIITDGCGVASSSVGPFYCPADFGIYIDVSFYDQLARMSGTGGDFARLYVMAHEYGHHVQNLTGLADQVRAAQQRNPAAANQINVAMELHADCYAGVWAGKNASLIEPGDLEEGMRAASAVGDDTIARQSGRRANPDNFTHGTSRQRVEALRRGMQSGNQGACDVYFE